MTLVRAILVASLAWAAPAIAAEEHGASINQLWFPLINFLLFLALIKYFGFPKVKEFLRDRHRDIATAISEAAEAQKRAESDLREIRRRLGSLDEETARMRLELRTEGETEKAKLLKEAEERARKLKADADFLAGQEVEAGRQKLREEIAEGARAVATRIVQVELREPDQKRLIEGFVKGLEAAG